MDANNTVVVPFEYDSISAVYKDYAYACKGGYLYVLKFTKNPNAGKPYETIFSDVAESDWFEPYVRAAYENGIITGVTTGANPMYAPGNNLKHAEILVMVANLHSLQKGDKYDFQAHKTDGAHWCSAYLEYCKAEGITDDRYDAVLDEYVTRSEMAYYFANALSAGTYRPAANVTRAEAAVFVSNLLKIINQ